MPARRIVTRRYCAWTLGRVFRGERRDGRVLALFRAVPPRFCGCWCVQVLGLLAHAGVSLGAARGGFYRVAEIRRIVPAKPHGWSTLALKEPSKTFWQRSSKVEAIGVHHLGPGRCEVLHELLLGVGGAIDFGKDAQLRVRTEDEIDTRAGPFRFAALAVVPREHVFVRGRFPLGAHVQEVYEEVVG